MNAAHLAEAQRQLQSADRPLLLKSPKDALANYGVLWFVEIDRILRSEFPDRYLGIEIDAGERADLAVEAMRLGLHYLAFSGHPEAAKALLSIARQLGAQIRLSQPKD